MNNKILIELIVPEIEATFNVYLPINRKIGNIINLLNKAIQEITDGAFIPTNSITLYNRETGSKYDVNDLLYNTDIRNGSTIILI